MKVHFTQMQKHLNFENANGFKSMSKKKKDIFKDVKIKQCTEEPLCPSAQKRYINWSYIDNNHASSKKREKN